MFHEENLIEKIYNSQDGEVMVYTVFYIFLCYNFSEMSVKTLS